MEGGRGKTEEHFLYTLCHVFAGRSFSSAVRKCGQSDVVEESVRVSGKYRTTVTPAMTVDRAVTLTRLAFSAIYFLPAVALLSAGRHIPLLLVEVEINHVALDDAIQ